MDEDFSAEFDDVDIQRSESKFKPWLILYAVDTHISSFIKDEESGKIAFQNYIEALLYCADNSLILTPRSMKSPLGVLLAENDIEKASFISYSQNMPENVKFLKKLSAKDPKELERDYLRKRQFDMADFLLLCKHQLDQVKKDSFKETIVFLTNNCDPVGKDEKLKDKIMRTIENLKDQNVELRIVTMDQNFDLDPFYGEMIQQMDFRPIEYVESCEDLKELLSSYLQIKKLKFTEKLFLFPGNWKKYLQVYVVPFLKESSIKNNIRVTKDKHIQVKKKMVEREPVTEVNISNPAYKDKSVRLTVSAEMANEVIKTDFPKGLVLLYTCKKISEPYWLIRPCSIVESRGGSVTEKYFHQVWNCLVNLDMVMVCYYKKRDNGKVYFVELTPRCINKTNCFIIKYLPTTEEYKGFPQLEVQELSKDMQAAMESVVDKLTFDFNVKMFRNPILKKKEEYIKSQLLKESYREEEDNSEEKEKSKIDALVKEEAQVLKKIFNVESKGTKRKK